MRNVLTSKLPKKKEEEEEKYHLDYIGEDGYVYKHNGEKYYKTGIFLQGPKGQPGVKGKDGLIPRIGKNGNWFIGDTDTFVKAALDTSLYATKKDLDDLIDNAPEVLNTLKELANAIGDDADFATNINNRLTDIENVAYQVPVGGIPESDLSQGVKDKINGKDVFVAEYEVTQFADIYDAIEAGKAVFVVKNNTENQNKKNFYGLFYQYSDEEIQFTLFNMDENKGTIVCVYSDDSWDEWDSEEYESSSLKTSSWRSSPDNIHYPSEKLVKDSLDAVDKLVEVEYGVTTYAEVKALVDAGKIPFVAKEHSWGSTYNKMEPLLLILSGHTNYGNNHVYTKFYFSSYVDTGGNNQQYYLAELAQVNDAWNIRSFSPEFINRRQQVFNSNTIQTYYYPSTKAVADYVDNVVGDIETLLTAI